MSSSANSIEKLHSGNYHTWKLRARMLLVKEGLWPIVSGIRKIPTVGKSSEASGDVAKWADDDQNALATIMLSISDSMLTHVYDCKTSSEAWTKLAEIHEPKGFASQRHLRYKYCSMKMSENGSIQDHISELDNIVRQLISMGITIGEKEQAMTLLDSMPQSYQNLVIVLEGLDNPSPEDIKARLLQEEARRNLNSSNGDAAFTSKKNAKSVKGK
jgi:gag-polypeptide of LTR copia-type